MMNRKKKNLLCGGGQEDGSPGEKGGERCTGGGIRGFGKREIEGGNYAKLRNISKSKIVKRGWSKQK